ncbi:GNAT family N-acetyltransferase [Pseudarthrobacter sp. NS4]|uniref:GNAT family N-acetyltransferase n=1 Tax=Pseudarthrobacter sp. NS4 TaxID=2973976 RepID=UPI0021620805|nr:GNAT family N-acetyltransferase [Pseudarthrobacter sp. NS4]
MDYVLRQAVPEDAEALVRMHTLAHEECYTHLLSSDFFRARRASVHERAQRRREFLAGSAPRIVCEDTNGTIVGFADAGPGRDDDGPVPLELYSIYTLRRTYGTGLGAVLLAAAVGEMPAYLWVLEDNPRAHAFYLKNGFRPDGRCALLPPEWENLPEIRMVRAAGPTGSL